MNTEQVFRQDAVVHATGRSPYRETVGPSLSDSEEEIVSQASNHGPGRRINEYREAQSPSPPPPPYSERDPQRRPLSPSSFELYPGEGGLPMYVPTSSGGRDRLVVDRRGVLVSWPFSDSEDTSGDGDEGSDMIYLGSGRILPRSERDARHTVEYSSEGPSDDTDGEVSQNHRRPMPQAGSRTPRHWSSEDESGLSERESPRVGSARSRYRGRQSLVGRGGRLRYRTGERRRHEDPQPRRRSGHH